MPYQVPWSLWWSEFPEALCEVHMTPDAVARLKELLASEAAKVNCNVTSISC